MASHFFEYLIIAGIFLLLPLIPSILVYKISPKDKVGVGGVFHALTINATGAFAGYLICCLFLYVFILKGFIAKIDEEKFMYDEPAFISQKVLLNSWEAKYSPLSGPDYIWRYSMKFDKDGNENIYLSGITSCKNDKNEIIDIIEWKSEPFKFSASSREFEIHASMKWLEGQLQFDPNITKEINKWKKGKMIFKSDYFLRGEFKGYDNPSDIWGIWLNRPPG